MNKRMIKNSIAVAGIALMLGTTAEATPAFARQMNTDCMACHFQNIPKLNSFGREFRLSGYTMTGGQEEITSDANGGLELQSNLNMSFMIKARYLAQNDLGGVNGVDRRLTELFDESALVFGGKMAKDIGLSIEFGNGGPINGKLIYSTDVGFGRVGGAFASTDAQGAFFGLEPYNTGLYRAIRQFENRSRANIFQKLGIGAGAAQGAQVFYSGNGLFATVGQYIPVYAPSTDTTADGYKTFARVAYGTNLGGMDIAVGGYYMGGDVRNNAYVAADTDLNALDRKSTGLDLQIEGNVADMSLMVTGGWVITDEYTAGGAITTALNYNDLSGFSIGAQLNPVENWGVKAAYLSSYDESARLLGANTNDEQTFTIGTDYNIAQNVRLTLEYSVTSFDDPLQPENQKDLLFMTNVAF